MAPYPIHQDQNIELITEGELYTNGLCSCFCVLIYFGNGEHRALAGGHHSPLHREEILPKWILFKQEHPDLTSYTSKRILIAGLIPEHAALTQWQKNNPYKFTYSERIDDVINALKELYPGAEASRISYSWGSKLKASIEDLTWQTDVSRGSLI